MKTHHFVLSSLTAASLALSSMNILAADAPAASFSSNQKQQIEQIIHDYLVNKPEVLIEASKSLQKKQMAEVSSKAKDGIAKNASSLFNSTQSPTLGNAKGDITIVEFLDYQCGHCKTMSPIIAELVKADPKLKVIIRGLPIFGESSKTATKAVIAATKQGDKFISFNEALLSTTGPLNEKNIFELAKKAGLDVSKLKKDMGSSEVENEIKENFRLAREIGLMGTPAFVVGNTGYTKTEFVAGAASKEDLTALIAKLRG